MTTARFDTIANIAGADDWQGDPFGTAINLQFDIAEVLNMSDVEGDITPAPFARWNYNPSPYVAIPALETVAARAEHFAEGEWADDFGYGVISLASALDNDQVTQSDLIYVGDVLSRYIGLLDKAGLTY